MRFLDTPVSKLFRSPQRDVSHKRPSKLLATPSNSTISRFSLPSTSASSSSSACSISSSSTFWLSSPRTRPRWSIARYVPPKMRSSISKRQMAVLLCIILILLVWYNPSPSSWRRRTIHLTIPQELSSPYRVLRPGATASSKRAPDPAKWLEQNSDNRYALTTKSKVFSPLRQLGQVSSPRPRAALISLVRNSELDGLVQSMSQLEYYWNRKYQYPWVFFNDEPFTEEFKVCPGSILTFRCLRSVRWPHKTLHRRNAITKSYRRSTGHYQTGLTREGS